MTAAFAIAQGTAAMQQQPNDHRNDSRLTPTEIEIRERCGKIPKRLQRNIDNYRIARRMPPLWARPQDAKR